MRGCFDGNVNGEVRSAAMAHLDVDHLGAGQMHRQCGAQGRSGQGPTVEGTARPIILPVDAMQPQ